MVDYSNRPNQRPRPMPDGDAFSAILQLPCCLRQVAGQLFCYHVIAPCCPLLHFTFRLTSSPVYFFGIKADKMTYSIGDS